jgi:hypothetical protein
MGVSNDERGTLHCLLDGNCSLHAELPLTDGMDGEMLVFEANANMNFLTNDHPEMVPRMNMIKKKIQEMLTRHSGEQVI